MAATQPKKSMTPRAWLAHAALSLGLGLGIWGCLNPRPDEDPSRSAPIDVPEPPSDADFCDRNPLAQDCDESDNSPGNGSVEPEPSEPDVVDVDAGVTDAGAQDAGPSANE